MSPSGRNAPWPLAQRASRRSRSQRRHSGRADAAGSTRSCAAAGGAGATAGSTAACASSICAVMPTRLRVRCSAVQYNARTASEPSHIAAARQRSACRCSGRPNSAAEAKQITCARGEPSSIQRSNNCASCWRQASSSPSAWASARRCARRLSERTSCLSSLRTGNRRAACRVRVGDAIARWVLLTSGSGSLRLPARTAAAW
ncbi:hypothetical protein D9M72_341030 [compost metagenome]